MNLSHLHYFATLFETKSFQETARSVSVTQPTLSQAINGLERELECQLFIRKKGSVEPTAEGETFYQYVATALRFLDSGVNLIHSSSRDQKKEISLGSIYSAQSKIWSQMIYDFRQCMHNDVVINIRQAPGNDLIRQLKDGSLDVAFVDNMGADPDLAYWPCWTQEVALVVNTQHPLAKKTSVSLTDLADHYLISYDLQGPLGAALTALIDNYDLQVGCRYNDEITLASIVMANPDVMAIACRSWLLDAYNNVCFIPIEEAPQHFRQLYLAYHSNAQQSQTVRRFITLAQELFPSNN